MEIAARRGVVLPLVYNTGGFDSLEALTLLDGVVVIYMPDMKYGNAETALRYSRIRDYVAVNQTAVREMHRQVGNLVMDPSGIARRGLLIRHLVLPGLLQETEAVLAFIAPVPSLLPGRRVPAPGPPLAPRRVFEGTRDGTGT